MAESQKMSGYVNGCRGFVLTVLNEDGSMPTSPEKHYVKTAQKAGFEPQYEDGQSQTLRGGDKVLSRVEKPDIEIGGNLKFVDARMDAKLAALVRGGTLIVQAPAGGVGDDEIIGMKAPTIEEQEEGSRLPCLLEVYAASFNGSGGRESWIKHTFAFCTGKAGSVEQADNAWATPEFDFKARQNPSTKDSYHKWEWVTSLPAGLQ